MPKLYNHTNISVLRGRLKTYITEWVEGKIESKTPPQIRARRRAIKHVQDQLMELGDRVTPACWLRWDPGDPLPSTNEPPPLLPHEAKPKNPLARQRKPQKTSVTGQVLTSRQKEIARKVFWQLRRQIWNYIWPKPKLLKSGNGFRKRSKKQEDRILASIQLNQRLVYHAKADPTPDLIWVNWVPGDLVPEPEQVAEEKERRRNAREEERRRKAQEEERLRYARTAKPSSSSSSSSSDDDE